MARVPESSRVQSVGVASLDGQARGTAQRAGQAIEETGRATRRAIEAATKFGTDLRRRRQQAEDGGFTSSVTTKARSRFQEVFLESRNQATEGAEDFAAAFQKRLDQETEVLIEAARAGGGRPSDRAIQDTRGRLQLLGAAFTGQAASFENNARIAKLTRDLTGGLDDLTRQAFDDPERRPELLDAADEGIDAAASFLPAADLEALRERTLSAITLASVNGVIDRDPELAAEMLEAGDFDEGLEAGRKAAFIASARTARRLEEEALAREAAADRRELRRDADAAIAKLRGGQPVAEVGAMESRAEALEDPETRAALRHAEDDQLFMRGFAQRSPAEQAGLIAAMENSPELKPVETRRLAAMKARATVTERALARDPLAYAQTSGVIEEPADLTDLTPEALRAHLRQAEITREQFGLAALPLLRPGEAEKIADKLAKGTPEDLQAKAEELAELPAEVRQVLFDEIAPELPLNARRVFRQAADLETEVEGREDPEPLPQPGALIDVPPEQIAQRQLQAQQARHGEINAFALNRILHSQPPAELQADFDRLQEDFFLRTGDLRLSYRLALQELDEIWGLAGEGPDLRIARRAEAEGEVRSLRALSGVQGGFDLESVFDAMLFLAELSPGGKAVGGGMKLGTTLFGTIRKSKKAARAFRKADEEASGSKGAGPADPRTKGVQELPPTIDTEHLVKVRKTAIDPTSRQQVLQDVGDVDEILRRAAQARAPFERKLKGISEDLGKGISFDATRVKERVRLGQKLERRPSNTLGDYLGGRLIVDTPADLRAAVKRIGQEFEVLDHDNFLMSPRDTGYRAVHIQVKLDNGISAEIQIIPGDISKVASTQRNTFERWRDPNLTPQERAEVDKLMEGPQAEFEAAFDRWVAKK